MPLVDRSMISPPEQAYGETGETQRKDNTHNCPRSCASSHKFSGASFPVMKIGGLDPDTVLFSVSIPM